MGKESENPFEPPSLLLWDEVTICFLLGSWGSGSCHALCLDRFFPFRIQLKCHLLREAFLGLHVYSWPLSSQPFLFTLFLFIPVLFSLWSLWILLILQLPPPLWYKLHGVKGFCLSGSLHYSQDLDQCLTCGRCSIHTCWSDKYRMKKYWKRKG